MTIEAPQEPAANQFQQFIEACEGDPHQLQDAYEKHRLNRNGQFKERILDPDFREWQFDEILENVLQAERGASPYVDKRNNLSFWARPPQHIRELIREIQQEISAVAGPCLWLTPADHLHMTTLEMVSSRTASEVDGVAALLQEKLPIHDIVDYTLTHRARLVRPVVSYDAAAMALSFVPAAGETTSQPGGAANDNYSYHHLRRDLWDIAAQSGHRLASRYNVPSAHVTIARFAVPPGLEKGKEVESLINRKSAVVEKIEDINQELRSSDWQRFGNSSRGEWIIGQERGLELNKGQSWFGKGEAVLIGKGF
ncbi:uncharacterized protein N7459_002033 [Penicillium hispanicum]|uniref:uncharacterized protein n=1 Tax=Penicillium hispanicum TaxID=1080232 RepID=UPI0025405AC2|nr:uncharacterized protein N7459_002033 [Penicillium hispanicum]KAJ5591664.1 hypothetical protein N7459_002033 [Penicillium hispanicum]